jgi:hypothetical protein
MWNGLRRRTVYLGTGIAILALVAGFTLAASNSLLTERNQTAEGNSTPSSGSVAGVTYVDTVLNVTPSPSEMVIQTELGAPNAPVTLAPGLNVFCLSGGPTAGGDPCLFGDFSEWENYTFTTSFTGAMQLTMFLGEGTHGAEQTLYVQQAMPTPVAGNLLLLWDLGTKTQSVSGLTITIDQCSSSLSCP